MHSKEDLSIDKKFILTVKEASIYSGIGTNRIYEMLKEPYCEFLLCVGRKRMVKRKEFEKYLTNSYAI